MRDQLVRCGLAFLALLAASAAAAADVTPSSRVTRNVVVRSSPTTVSDPLEALEPGETLPLDAELSGWYRVRLPDGRAGFVSKAWTDLTDAPVVAAGQGYRVHVIDVGTGLAVFVEGPGFTLLYDGGSQDDLADGADNRILAYINAVRPGLQTIDHLILSHPHKDHLELLPDVFDRFAVRHVWNSGAVNRTRGYCRFLRKVAAEPGVRYHDAIASSGTYQVSFTGTSCAGPVSIARSTAMSAAPVALGTGARMAILHRDASAHSDPNENTVVVRLDLGSRRVLLAGDAEGGERLAPTSPPHPTSVEAKLLQCCAADLRADVLVVGHHGSLTSSRRAFLDAVGAGTYVISSGPFPYKSVRLPDDAIRSELRARGSVFETNDGDEACLLDASKVGPDADESPGGCKNVLVAIDAAGQLAAAYHEIVD